MHNLLIKARNNPIELAPYATQDSLEDIQVRILENIELLNRLKRYRDKRLLHFDSTEMDNIELPSEDVNALVEETKSIFNALKFSHVGEHDRFDDIMVDVNIRTSQVIKLISSTDKHG